MSTIVTRAGKGSALSHAEVDANFTNLNTDKVEGQAASVDSEIALFSGLGGKTIKRATTTGVLKATSGVLSAAAAGTDFQAPITASGVLKGAGAGSVSAAVAGTDYLAPPSGTAILKANSGGALANAVANTDYLTPPSGTAILKANSGGALANAVAGTDYASPTLAHTWTLPQRGQVTAANSGSFDMNVENNFTCTPTAGITLTFTNITAGQSGFITLVNGSNYTISKAAAVKVASGLLTTLSATGTYLLSYHSPDGTNVYLTATAALS